MTLLVAPNDLGHSQAGTPAKRNVTVVSEVGQTGQDAMRDLV